MSLNVPGNQSQNPELEEFKEQVVSTARKYAKRHNLCSVVDDALNEMGVISPADNIPVTSKVVVEFELKSLVDQTKFAGLNEVEELATAARLLVENFKVSGQNQGVVSGQTVRVLSIDHRDTDNPAFDQKGLVKKFVSSEGRVGHLFRNDANFNGTGYAYHDALCGQNIGWHVHMNHLRDFSPRDTGGVCKKCETKANSLVSV